jgi:hypothetical protein
MISVNLLKTVRFKMRHCRGPGQAVIASLLTGLVLLLNAMAASPALHKWFHADAGKAEHQCVVMLFAHGQVDSASVAAPVVAPLAWIQTVPSVEITHFSPVIENLPAGRGPPILPAVS